MTDSGPDDTPTDSAPDSTPSAAEIRLRDFARHLGAYFVVMAALVAVNFLTSETPWFLLPLIGWGAVLALHATYAMGLFSIFKRDDEEK